MESYGLLTAWPRAFDVVDDNGIFVDVDLLAAHRIAHPLGALHGLLADNNLLRHTRLLLQFDLFTGQGHVDDDLLEGLRLIRANRAIDDAPLDPNLLVRDGDL